MDPLSISASVLTLATAALGTLNALRTLYRAPKEIETLISEVESLKMVTSSITSIYQDLQYQGLLPREQLSALTLTLDQVKSKLLELDEVLTYCLQRAGSTAGNIKADRFALYKKKSHLEALMTELRDARFNMTTVLLAVNSSSSARIEAIVHEVVAISRDLMSSQRAFNRQAGQSTIDYDERQQLSMPAQPEAETTEDVKEELSNQGQLGKSRRIASSDHAQMKRSTNGSASALTIGNLKSETLHFRREDCSVGCGCSCHKQHGIKTPLVFDYVFGSVRAGYYGFNAAQCNERSCAKPWTKAAQISCFFPSWLLARMVCITVLTTPLSSPSVSLKFPRMIDSQAAVFALAAVDDVDGLIALFREGKASPHDIQYTLGIPALHFATAYSHISAMKLLLAAGADPYTEDRYGQAPIDYAWDQILGSTIDQSVKDDIQGLFTNRARLNRRQFPPLHKIILHLIEADLESHLKLSTAGIDDTDLDGRTALSWAASRGDGEAVKVLLKYHANPNVECRKCISPLQYACQTNTTSCIKPLLDAGAAPNHANAWKYRPLHYVALYQDDERLVNLLVKFGAFLDARDDYERTPLARASTNGRAKSAAALLDGGADIDAVDAAGDPPLFLAISHNAHEVIRLLLRHGADYSIRRKSKNHSILHLAAQKADRTTLEILTGAGMDGLDPEERDEQGLAPGDIILARLDRSIELVEAFDSLVRSTNYLFDRDGECQDEVESEAYEDAMEKLSALESTLE